MTRFLPTLITGPAERFLACARLLAACPDPAVAGLHMEGPYLAPEAAGAHPDAHLAPPSFEDFSRRQEAAGGRILLVTLAPEVPGALPLIERLVAAGVRVAIGHSAAGPGAIRDAVHAGATLSTHLGNACPLLLPRHPNLLWEQLAADELAAGLIVDGHHLPPSVVKVMVRAKSLARTVLVTDAIAAAGPAPRALPAGRGPGRAVGRRAGHHRGHRPAGRVGADPRRGAGQHRALHRLQPGRRWLPLASTQPAAAVGRTTAGRVFATP